MALVYLIIVVVIVVLYLLLRPKIGITEAQEITLNRHYRAPNILRGNKELSKKTYREIMEMREKE